jgi:hypothetical protein
MQGLILGYSVEGGVGPPLSQRLRALTHAESDSWEQGHLDCRISLGQPSAGGG